MVDLIRDKTPDVRFLNDMKDFIYDTKWAEAAPNYEMYYMYRGVAKDNDDKKTMDDNSLRHNITVMTPQMLGVEFPKTIGHEHTLVPGTNITYPEMYGVLEGEAVYLLQKYQSEKISDIYAVRTKAGEKCIVPPNYGHVTINPSGKEIIMADWSKKIFKSDYSLFRQNRGAGYYAVEKNSTIKWIKNENYGKVPEIRIYEAKDFNWLFEHFGIDSATPMYELLKNPEKLDFLKNPQNYDWE